MKRNSLKEWTILIYSDGNNEIEPEMWKAKLEAEKYGSGENVNVIMQIGRESLDLARIIRPSTVHEDEGESFIGVRRYYLLNTGSMLISDLGKLNMADPHNLYDFIKWGIENHPSKHIMLILSSHGFSFVAVMPDLSQDLPYMMGVTQMCKVINMVQHDLGVQIDILVLDMCHMNSIEILYELGKSKENSIKYVITYIKNGPLNGLSYGNMIKAIDKANKTNDTTSILKNIIDNNDFNLVAIEINHSKLKRIKGIINSLAYTFLTNENYKEKTPAQLLYELDSKDENFNQIKELKKFLKGLVIHYKNLNQKDSLISINTMKAADNSNGLNLFMLIYYTLSFNKNNYWFNLLADKTIDDDIEAEINSTEIILEPTVMHPMVLENLIWALNTNLDSNGMHHIYDKLIEYKGWSTEDMLYKFSKQIENLTHANGAELKHKI